MKKPIPTEHQEQVNYFELIAMYETQHPELSLISATQNGMFSNPKHVNRLKRAGLKPGYPDIIIDVAKRGYNGARIELKRRDGGKGLSEYQRYWFRLLESQNYFCKVANGYNEAWSITCRYLGI